MTLSYFDTINVGHGGWDNGVPFDYDFMPIEESNALSIFEKFFKVIERDDGGLVLMPIHTHTCFLHPCSDLTYIKVVTRAESQEVSCLKIKQISHKYMASFAVIFTHKITSCINILWVQYMQDAFPATPQICDVHVLSEQISRTLAGMDVKHVEERLKQERRKNTLLKADNRILTNSMNTLKKRVNELTHDKFRLWKNINSYTRKIEKQSVFIDDLARALEEKRTRSNSLEKRLEELENDKSFNTRKLNEQQASIKDLTRSLNNERKKYNVLFNKNEASRLQIAQFQAVHDATWLGRLRGYFRKIRKKG
jgi:lysophospholipase L1-like esterase